MAAWRHKKNESRLMSDPAAMTRPIGRRCLLSAAEQVDFDRLAAWWVTWQPPAQPYWFNSGTLVTDPARSHRWICGGISAGYTFHSARHVLWWMREHAKRCSDGESFSS